MEAERWRVEEGDCLDLLERLPADSVDAVVTDPPYGLEFMGQDWDKPWAVGFRQLGHDGAEDRRAMPQHGSARNPVCRTCRKHRRGSDRCACDVPDFDESPADAMRAFQAWSERWARACLRVLRPGGHLLAFGGTRTYHRLACAVEDAGFEIRDRMLTLNGHVLGPELDWLYGSGWPKSRDISKAIDKRAGATREVIGVERSPFKVDAAEGLRRAYGEQSGGIDENGYRTAEITAPATPEAAQWDGWGTALKPAHEPIVVARKPFRGTVEEQVLATGTGAINIAATRIDTGGEVITAGLSNPENRRGIVGAVWQAPSNAERNQQAQRESLERANALGRWPANVALLHSPECERIGTKKVRGSRVPPSNGSAVVGYGGTTSAARPARGYGDEENMEEVEAWACVPGCPVAELDAQTGELRSGEPGVHRGRPNTSPAYGDEYRPDGQPMLGYGDRGGASRFFYSGKANPREREYGLDDLPEGLGGGHLGQGDEHRMGRSAEEGARTRERPKVRNVHPTVKPLELMRWLVRLVTPPGGVVLDPFTGSGSTGCAASLEGVRFIGFERDETYAGIARRRIAAWAEFPPGTDVERVLAVENERQRGNVEAEERRRELASVGQLDLLASGGLIE